MSQFILYVLLLNIFSATAVSAASNFNDTLSGSQQNVVICTPQGLKTISLDENGNPTGRDDGRLAHCIYCLPFHNIIIDVFLPENDFRPFDIAAHIPHNSPHSVALPDPVLSVSWPPRAPPLTQS